MGKTQNVCYIACDKKTKKYDIYTENKTYSVEPKDFFEELDNLTLEYSRIYFWELGIFYKPVIERFLEKYEDKTSEKEDISSKTDVGCIHYTIGHSTGIFKIKVIPIPRHSCIISNANLKCPLSDEIFFDTYGHSKKGNRAKALKEAMILTKSSTIAGEAMSKFTKRGLLSDSLSQTYVDEDGDTQTFYDFILPAYKGGFNLYNYHYVDTKVGPGMILDVNGLYSYVMMNEFPVGKGTYKKGEPPMLKSLRYIIHFEADFRIKEGYIPFLTEKNINIFTITQPVESSETVDIETGEIVCNLMDLTLTDVEFEMFKEFYEIREIHFIDYIQYRSGKGLFHDFVRSTIKEKEEAEDKGTRTVKKFICNGLSGKMAARKEYENAILKLDSSGKSYIADIKTTPNKMGSYIQVGAFITSYARCMIVRLAQELGGLNEGSRWLYSDTDSLHILGTDIPDFIQVDSKKLGKFKVEHEFDWAIYYGLKRYITFKDGVECHCVFAGLQEKDRIFLEDCIYTAITDMDWFDLFGAPVYIDDWDMTDEEKLKTITNPENNKNISYGYKMLRITPEDMKDYHTSKYDIHRKKDPHLKLADELFKRIKEHGVYGIRGCDWFRHYYTCDKTFVPHEVFGKMVL